MLELSDLPTTEQTLCETHAAFFLDICLPQWLRIRIIPKIVDTRAQCVLMCHPALRGVLLILSGNDEETKTGDACTSYG